MVIEFEFIALGRGQKDLVSPAGSVGASASQRSPPETRTSSEGGKTIPIKQFNKLKFVK